MVFNIIVSKRAQSEIENAIEYYTEINTHLATKFFASLIDSYSKLELNPYFEKRYKNYRAIKLYKFPFLLFYIIEEDKKQIKVLSCFHTARSSKKYPK